MHLCDPLGPCRIGLARQEAPLVGPLVHAAWQRQVHVLIRTQLQVRFAPTPVEGGALPSSPRLEVDDVLVVKGRRMRTAIGGTVVGNVMEWFDFGVYGYMAVMLSQLFFQTGSDSLDLILSLLAFAVSFLVRPLGGLVLGPLGDRIGRQKVLFFTMAMMALATALIGLLPTFDDIGGVWAAFLLYALKMIQGFSTGGEYAGATTYVSEFSPDRKRGGFYSSLLDVGSYFGFAMGAGAVALTHLITSQVWGPDAMLDWGWRVPFLLAIPLGAVAIWFRARIPETPPPTRRRRPSRRPRGSPTALWRPSVRATIRCTP